MAKPSRARPSRIHTPGLLMVALLRPLALAGRQGPSRDHHRQNEENNDAGDHAEHCLAPPIYFHEDSGEQPPRKLIDNFWLTRGRGKLAIVGFAASARLKMRSLQ